MNKKILGKKKFTVSDQKYFSSISHDFNPTHYDFRAKKIFLKRKIVHGINILITAIDFWIKKEKSIPEVIQCNFVRPLKLFDNAIFFYFKISESKYSIEVKINNMLYTKILLDFNHAQINKNYNFSTSKSILIKKSKKALDIVPKFFIHKKFKIKLNKRNNFKKFYLKNTTFGKNLYSSLLEASFFIGMICPGKNAIFTSIKFRLTEIANKNDYIYFFVKKFDNRVNIFEIVTKGFIQSEIKAFYRPSFKKSK